MHAGDQDDALVRRVEWSLHGVRDSRGYRDTAEQIVADLGSLFPDRADAARQLAELQAEVDRLRFELDSARRRLQFRARVARRGGTNVSEC